MLTTLAKFKSYIGDSGTTNDTVYTSLLTAASKFIENYTGRTFDSTTYTNEIYDGNGVDTIRLNQYPITTFTRLQKRASWDNTDDWEDVDSENYYTDLDEGLVTMVGTFEEGKQNYRVTYTAGYSSVPKDIELVCWMVTRDLFNQRKTGSNVTAETLKDYSVNYTGTYGMLSIEARHILDIYRDIEI